MKIKFIHAHLLIFLSISLILLSCAYENRLVRAVNKEDYATVAQIVKNNSVNYNKKIIKASLVNAFYNDFNIAKLFLENGASANKRIWGITPLSYASVYSNFKLVKYLVRNGAYLNYRNRSSEKFKFEKINIKKSTALMLASSIGNYKVVKYLVQNGAKIDLKNDNGETALTLAEKNNHKKVVEFLAIVL